MVASEAEVIAVTLLAHKLGREATKDQRDPCLIAAALLMAAGIIMARSGAPEDDMDTMSGSWVPFGAQVATASDHLKAGRRMDS